MKVLVALSAVIASCLAYAPSIGYSYSAIAPITAYSSLYAPYSYGYNAPIISAAPVAAPLAAPYAAPLAAPLAPAPVAAAVKTQHHSQDELGQASYGHTEPLQAHNAIQDAAGNKVGSFSYVDPHGAVHQTNYVADAHGYRVQSNDLPLALAAPLHRRKRQAWTGPQASPVVTPTGHLAETPEVAAARAAHFAEHARQNSAPQQQPQAATNWNQAQQNVWSQQQPAPTAYSAPAAKAWNQQPQAPAWQQPQAQAWQQPQAAPAWQQPQPQAWSQARAANAPAPSWSQAPAVTNWGQSVPTVGQSGTIAETPEVAAARAAHFAEHAKIASSAPSPAPVAEQQSQWNQAPAAPESRSWSEDGSYKQVPTPSWNAAPAAPANSWNQGQSTQSWDDQGQWNQGRSYNQAPAAQWSEDGSYTQTPAASWNQDGSYIQSRAASWNSSPSGGIADTPEVAAARAAHLAEHAAAAHRSKRSVALLAPAGTTPLVAAPAPVIPYAAAAPAVIPYAAPAYAHGAHPAILTTIVNNPGHAVSYRID